jgi:hypothetical protein
MADCDVRSRGSRPSDGRGAARVAAVLTLSTLATLASTAGAAIHVPERHSTIQGAIDAASPGDTVFVAPGTYTGEGNVGLDFGGKDIVLIAPGGPDSTVIDCEFASRGLIFENGESPDALVEGFTVTHGWGGSGAGVRCVGSSPTIRNVVFLYNRALGWGDQSGGGVDCQEADPVLDGVTFIGNLAYRGAGMACSHSSPRLRGVVFLENSAFGAGGGLYAYSSSVAMEDVVFDGNEASYAGGGACLYRADAEIRGSRFERNACESDGGGVCCWESGPVSLTDVRFLGNNTGREGAGVYSYRATLTLARATFARNVAGTYGGAASFSAGTEADVTNVTVVVNAAGARGSGFCCRASHPEITLSVFGFNGPRDAILCLAGGNPVVRRCVVFGNEMGDGLCGTHGDNLFIDPLFCDLPADEFRLCANSPCLPENGQNPWGALVGSEDEGCGSCDSAVQPASWGTIKTLFLGREESPRVPRRGRSPSR